MWPITGMPASTIARTRESIGPAPSSLTASAPPSLTRRIAFCDRVLVGDLVRAERHVADDERPLRAARDRARQEEHLVHRHRHGRVVAEHDHAAESPTRTMSTPAASASRALGRVVGGDHHDLLAAALHLGELGDRQLSRSRGVRAGIDRPVVIGGLSFRGGRCRSAASSRRAPRQRGRGRRGRQPRRSRARGRRLRATARARDGSRVSSARGIASAARARSADSRTLRDESARPSVSRTVSTTRTATGSVQVADELLDDRDLLRVLRPK